MCTCSSMVEVFATCCHQVDVYAHTHTHIQAYTVNTDQVVCFFQVMQWRRWNRQMWGTYTCTRIRDGTQWPDTQTSKTSCSRCTAKCPQSIFAVVLELVLKYKLCVSLLQKTSYRPSHVEWRVWAEGVHKKQHTPSHPSVVLGRKPPKQETQPMPNILPHATYLTFCFITTHSVVTLFCVLGVGVDRRL